MISEAILTHIESDLHVGPQFVEMCRQFHVDENAVFLLAVIRYKKNPTWDSCLSMWHKYIVPRSSYADKKSGGGNFGSLESPSAMQVNLPSGIFAEIEKYIKFWGENQSKLTEQKVTLHVGTNPNLFDKAFKNILDLLDTNLESRDCKARADKFMADYHVV